MANPLAEFASHVRWADLLDIGIVAALVYLALLWLRRHVVPTAVAALALMAVLYVVARSWDLYLTLVVFRAGFMAILVALAIVFQNDIRRAFDRVTTWGKSITERVASSQTADLLVESCFALADRRIGALVVLQGRESLEGHVHGGVVVRGEMSLPLLLSIFDPTSPGHDGAAVVEGEQLERFAAHLPLSTRMDRLSGQGTRHAAALGLAERCDALVLVVSEERGTVSVAQRGEIESADSAALLRARLSEFFTEVAPRDPGRSWRAGLVRNIGLKLAAVTVAVTLWLTFAYRVAPMRVTYPDVPVAYANLPEPWTLDPRTPSTVSITLLGKERELNQVQPDQLTATVDLSRIREGVQYVPLTEKSLPDLAGARIEPQTLRVIAHRLHETELPVRAATTGAPPAPLVLRRIEVRPARVRLLLPGNRAQWPPSMATEPVDLSRVERDTTRRVRVLSPPGARWPGETAAEVEVRIDVEPAAAQ